MSERITPLCQTCTWWAEKNDFEDTKRGTVEKIGECRRYPPQTASNMGWFFPKTGSDCGCGEWQKQGDPPREGE